MTVNQRVRVNAPGTSIHGWEGRVASVATGGAAWWVEFEQDLPISLRESTKDKRTMYLTNQQVEELP